MSISLVQKILKKINIIPKTWIPSANWRIAGMTLPLLFLPLLVSAHASPLIYTPESNSTLPMTPEEIRIKFSERVESGASSITVTPPDGSKQVLTATVDTADSHTLKANLNASSTGTYTVSWQVVSADDGHITKGGYQFIVGTEDNNPYTVIQGLSINHTSNPLEAWTTGLELTGQAILVGLALLLFLLIPKLGGPLTTAQKRRLKVTTIVSLALIIFGDLGYIAYKSYSLFSAGTTSFWQSLGNFSTTVSGSYTWIRLIILSLAGILIYQTIDNHKQWKKYAITLLLLASELARARVSHAAASHFYPVISVIINFIHLVAKDSLLGTLIALIALISQTGTDEKIKTTALAWFNKLAAVAIIIGGVTGSYVVWLHLKTWDNLLTTTWGKIFLPLSIYAAIFVALRVYHHSLTNGYLTFTKKKNHFLPITQALEVGTAVLILITSATLIVTTPPLPAVSYPTFGNTDQNITTTLSVHPNDQNAMLISLTDTKGLPVAPQHLTVLLENQERGIAAFEPNLTQRSDHTYSFPKSSFSAAGAWKVEIITQPQNGFDSNAHFTITTPQDLQQAPPNYHTPFTWSIAAIGLISVLLGFGLSLLTGPGLRGSDKSVAVWTKGVWVFPLLLMIVVDHLTHGAHGGLNLTQASFERLCIAQGGVWHESIPTYNGASTGTQATPGCAPDHDHLFHFASFDEYKYFLRKENSFAILLNQPDSYPAETPVPLTFQLSNSQLEPQIKLTQNHGAFVHAIIFGQDLTQAHLHPTFTGKPGLWETSYTFPRAGRYLIALDFNINNQTITEIFPLTIAGDTVAQPEYKEKLMDEHDGYTLTLRKAPIYAKSLSTLTVDISKNGKPATDLTPYLNSVMHVTGIDSNLTNYFHGHGFIPENQLIQFLTGETINPNHQPTPEKFGPTISAEVRFPAPGTYHVVTETVHEGKILKGNFIVQVAE